MRSRIDFHEELVNVLGSKNVYYQPPETVKLVYPCILYELGDIDVRKADNKNYIKNKSYVVTYITKQADDPKTEEILDAFTMCSFDRQYKASNLYHNVFTIYY